MFIGREAELNTLKSTFDLKRSQLVVIKGRRRVGKTRLAREVSKTIKGAQCFYFTASPPDMAVSDEQERHLFAQSITREFALPYSPSSASWSELLHFVADQCRARKTVLILDEINWMGSQCKTFLKELHNVWETNFAKKRGFMLIMAGSLSTWLDKNILHHTGFVGRVDLDMTLKDMPLKDCVQFWGSKRKQWSDYEITKLLCITGGVPRYIEALDFSLSADHNIVQLCLTPSGLLFDEFDDMFSDIFSTYNDLYLAIFRGIAATSSRLTVTELAKTIERPHNGTFSKCIDNLEQSGFITRDYAWDPHSKKILQKPKLRISDCYTAFYFRAIDKNKNPAKSGVITLKNFSSLAGLQFENLILNSRTEVFRLLGIDPAHVEFDNPFYQSPRTRRAGCQIDYLIQTSNHILYICEIKFHLQEIGSQVVSEMENKINALKIPKHFTYRKVLIHVNGVKASVEDSGYFDRLLCVSELM